MGSHACVGLALALLVAVVAAQPPLPPSQYSVSFLFEMPENPALSEPVTIVYDGVGGNEIVSYYGGMDQNLFLTVNGKQRAFQITPTGSLPSNVQTECSTSGIDLAPFMFSAFPANLSAFVDVGQVTIDSIVCNAWLLNQTAEGGALAVYKYYTDAAGDAPVQFEYIGFSGSAVGFANSPNYDWFVVKYTAFSAGLPSNVSFAVPAICQHARKSASVATPRQVAHRYGAVVSHDELFDEFKAHHGKAYGSDAEHAARRSHFMANVDTIHRLNLEHKSATFAVNHLADRTRGELGLRRMRAREYSGKLDADANEHVKVTKSIDELPAAFDWREHGYDVGAFMHEQGDCGSCWTFGAAGSFAGTYFVKHGVLLDFSKQVLMDCSWPTDAACDGGTPGTAYKTIQRLGGWPLEADYPYLMNNGKCHKAPSNATIAKGYDVTPFDKHALMDALVTYGPIAVAVDAQPVGWNFYHSGVATMPGCNSHSLDHEVLLVGYTSVNGVDAWIILNSWSQYWGQNGYLLLAMENNLCGVLTSPQYALPN